MHLPPQKRQRRKNEERYLRTEKALKKLGRPPAEREASLRGFERYTHTARGTFL